MNRRKDDAAKSSIETTITDPAILLLRRSKIAKWRASKGIQELDPQQNVAVTSVEKKKNNPGIQKMEEVVVVKGTTAIQLAVRQRREERFQKIQALAKTYKVVATPQQTGLNGNEFEKRALSVPQRRHANNHRHVLSNSNLPSTDPGNQDAAHSEGLRRSSSLPSMTEKLLQVADNSSTVNVASSLDKVVQPKMTKTSNEYVRKHRHAQSIIQQTASAKTQNRTRRSSSDNVVMYQQNPNKDSDVKLADFKEGFDLRNHDATAGADSMEQERSGETMKSRKFAFIHRLAMQQSISTNLKKDSSHLDIRNSSETKIAGVASSTKVKSDDTPQKSDKGTVAVRLARQQYISGKSKANQTTNESFTFSNSSSRNIDHDRSACGQNQVNSATDSNRHSIMTSNGKSSKPSIESASLKNSNSLMRTKAAVVAHFKLTSKISENHNAALGEACVASSSQSQKTEAHIESIEGKEDKMDLGKREDVKSPSGYNVVTYQAEIRQDVNCNHTINDTSDNKGFPTEKQTDSSESRSDSKIDMNLQGRGGTNRITKITQRALLRSMQGTCRKREHHSKEPRKSNLNQVFTEQIVPDSMQVNDCTNSQSNDDKHAVSGDANAADILAYESDSLSASNDRSQNENLQSNDMSNKSGNFERSIETAEQQEQTFCSADGPVSNSELDNNNEIEEDKTLCNAELNQSPIRDLQTDPPLNTLCFDTVAVELDVNENFVIESHFLSDDRDHKSSTRDEGENSINVEVTDISTLKNNEEDSRQDEDLGNAKSDQSPFPREHEKELECQRNGTDQSSLLENSLYVDSANVVNNVNANTTLSYKLLSCTLDNDDAIYQSNTRKTRDLIQVEDEPVVLLKDMPFQASRSRHPHGVTESGTTILSSCMMDNVSSILHDVIVSRDLVSNEDSDSGIAYDVTFVRKEPEFRSPQIAADCKTEHFSNEYLVHATHNEKEQESNQALTPLGFSETYVSLSNVVQHTNSSEFLDSIKSASTESGEDDSVFYNNANEAPQIDPPSCSALLDESTCKDSAGAFLPNVEKVVLINESGDIPNHFGSSPYDSIADISLAKQQTIGEDLATAFGKQVTDACLPYSNGKNSSGVINSQVRSLDFRQFEVEKEGDGSVTEPAWDIHKVFFNEFEGCDQDKVRTDELELWVADKVTASDIALDCLNKKAKEEEKKEAVEEFDAAFDPIGWPAPFEFDWRASESTRNDSCCFDSSDDDVVDDNENLLCAPASDDYFAKQQRLKSYQSLDSDNSSKDESTTGSEQHSDESNESATLSGGEVEYVSQGSETDDETPICGQSKSNSFEFVDEKENYPIQFHIETDVWTAFEEEIVSFKRPAISNDEMDPPKETVAALCLEDKDEIASQNVTDTAPCLDENLFCEQESRFPERSSSADCLSRNNDKKALDITVDIASDSEGNCQVADQGQSREDKAELSQLDSQLPPPPPPVGKKARRLHKSRKSQLDQSNTPIPLIPTIPKEKLEQWKGGAFFDEVLALRNSPKEREAGTNCNNTYLFDSSNNICTSNSMEVDPIRSTVKADSVLALSQKSEISEMRVANSDYDTSSPGKEIKLVDAESENLVRSPSVCRNEDAQDFNLFGPIDNAVVLGPAMKSLGSSPAQVESVASDVERLSCRQQTIDRVDNFTEAISFQTSIESVVTSTSSDLLSASVDTEFHPDESFVATVVSSLTQTLNSFSIPPPPPITEKKPRKRRSSSGSRKLIASMIDLKQECQVSEPKNCLPPRVDSPSSVAEKTKNKLHVSTQFLENITYETNASENVEDSNEAYCHPIVRRHSQRPPSPVMSANYIRSRSVRRSVSENDTLSAQQSSTKASIDLESRSPKQTIVRRLMQRRRRNSLGCEKDSSYDYTDSAYSVPKSTIESLVRIQKLNEEMLTIAQRILAMEQNTISIVPLSVSAEAELNTASTVQTIATSPILAGRDPDVMTAILKRDSGDLDQATRGSLLSVDDPGPLETKEKDSVLIPVTATSQDIAETTPCSVDSVIESFEDDGMTTSVQEHTRRWGSIEITDKSLRQNFDLNDIQYNRITDYSQPLLAAKSATDAADLVLERLSLLRIATAKQIACAFGSPHQDDSDLVREMFPRTEDLREFKQDVSNNISPLAMSTVSQGKGSGIRGSNSGDNLGAKTKQLDDLDLNMLNSLASASLDAVNNMVVESALSVHNSNPVDQVNHQPRTASPTGSSVQRSNTSRDSLATAKEHVVISMPELLETPQAAITHYASINVSSESSMIDSDLQHRAHFDESRTDNQKLSIIGVDCKPSGEINQSKDAEMPCSKEDTVSSVTNASTTELVIAGRNKLLKTANESELSPETNLQQLLGLIESTSACEVANVSSDSCLKKANEKTTNVAASLTFKNMITVQLSPSQPEIELSAERLFLGSALFDADDDSNVEAVPSSVDSLCEPNTTVAAEGTIREVMAINKMNTIQLSRNQTEIKPSTGILFFGSALFDADDESNVEAALSSADSLYEPNTTVAIEGAIQEVMAMSIGNETSSVRQGSGSPCNYPSSSHVKLFDEDDFTNAESVPSPATILNGTSTVVAGGTIEEATASIHSETSSDNEDPLVRRFSTFYPSKRQNSEVDEIWGEGGHNNFVSAEVLQETGSRLDSTLMAVTTLCVANDPVNRRYVFPMTQPSPFTSAIESEPVIISYVLSFLGDPVAVCRFKSLNKPCFRYVAENEYVLFRDAVRLGGISMNVRPYFWIFVTLEKCCFAAVKSSKSCPESVENVSKTYSSQEDELRQLEQDGRSGKWSYVIARDVPRAFGNLPPHKSGNKLRTDSIVRALVSWGRTKIKKSKSMDRNCTTVPDDISSDEQDGSITPTGTVSDWGGVSQVGSFASNASCPGLPEDAKAKSAIILSKNLADTDLALNGNGISADEKIALQQKLRFVLHALAAAHPEVGYCQGMDYVVAHLLRILKESVLWKAANGTLPLTVKCKPWFSYQLNSVNDLVVAYEEIEKSLVVEEVCFRIMDTFFTVYDLQHYYWPELRCLKTCCRVFEKLIQIKLPVLADHFDHHELNVGLFALGWFQTLFLYLPSMPSSTVCHMWDIWLVERSYKIFFRVATAILFLSQPILLNHDLEGMMSYLNTFPDATLLCPDILIACALKIKVTNRMLMELEQEVVNEMEELLNVSTSQLQSP